MMMISLPSHSLFFNWQTLAFCAVFLDLIADTHTSTQFCPLHQTSIKLWVSDPSNLSKADSNIHFFRHKPIQVLEVHSQSLHSIPRYISHLSFSANYKEGFLGPGEISAYGWLGRGGCKENRKVVNSCHAPLFSNWNQSVRASHPAQPSASFLHWAQLTLVADQLVRTKVVEKETPQYWSKERPGWNGIRDACSSADIIDCLQMALSLELFEYCSMCSDWITVVFWGNSLDKLIRADVSQCFPHKLQQFPQRWK